MKEWKAVTEPLGRLAARMKQDKRIELAVYVLLAALGILVYTASCGKEPEAAVQTSLVEAPAETAVEERLEEVLSCIRGAGKVRVMITYDTGAQVVPAMRTEVQSSTQESAGSDTSSVHEDRTEVSAPATLNDEALVLSDKTPAVRGVFVIAEGAADIAVKLRLQSAVQTVLGIDPGCIEVFEMSRPAYEEGGEG